MPGKNRTKSTSQKNEQVAVPRENLAPTTQTTIFQKKFKYLHSFSHSLYQIQYLLILKIASK